MLALVGSYSGAQTQRGFGKTAATATAPPAGNYYALVIGINDYPGDMPKLKTAVNDATAVGQLLHDRYGFDVQYLRDHEATRANILTALHKYRSALGDDDNLLIYYGGHGYRDKDAQKVYWLPVDADSADSPNRIIVDDLTSEIRALHARHVLVVSDSCYSGGLSRDVGPPRPAEVTPQYLLREASTRSRTLMASGGIEPVSDAGSDGHSVFANAVLRALDEQSDPIFSMRMLFYDRVHRQVAGNSEQLPEYDPLVNSGDDGGDFIFTLKVAGAHAKALPAAAGKAIEVAPSAPIAPAVRTPGKSVELAFSLGSLSLMAYKQGDAVAQFTIACSGGKAAACMEAGRIYGEGGNGVKRDPDRAFTYNTLACHAGDAAGCQALGLDYANGEGVGKDPARAVELFKQACTGGSYLGCRSLGARYASGEGTVRNAPQAVFSFNTAFELGRKACDGGDMIGCRLLGLLYSDGQGVAKDAAEGNTYMRRACDGGDMVSCTSLGVALRYGTGARADPAQAVALYTKSCKAGELWGCHNLGNLTLQGLGTPQNRELAIQYFRMACDGGLAQACKNLEGAQGAPR